MRILTTLSAMALATSASAYTYTPNNPTSPTPFVITEVFGVTYNGVKQSECDVTLSGNITPNGKLMKMNRATVTSGACVINSSVLPWVATPTGANPGVGWADVTIWYNGTPCSGTPSIYTEDKGEFPGLVLFTPFGVPGSCWVQGKGTSSPVIGVAPSAAH